MSVVDDREFSAVLRNAIDSSGKTLAQIVEELASSGVRLTQATLSYWQSGRSRPRRRNSLEAVTVLEHVLGLPDRTLLIALGAEEEGKLAEVMSYLPKTNFGNLASTACFGVNLENEPQSQVIFDEFTVYDQGQTLQVKTNRVVKIVSDDSLSVHVAYSWDRTSLPPKIVDVHGAMMAKERTFQDSGDELVRFSLPQNLKAGDLYRFGFTTVFRPGAPSSNTELRWLPSYLALYSTSVTFADRLPRSLRFVSIFGQNERQVSTEIDQQLSSLSGVPDASQVVQGGDEELEMVRSETERVNLLGWSGQMNLTAPHASAGYFAWTW